MALESWMFGNPETVLIRKQELAARKAQECGQCVHKLEMEFRGEVGYFCKFKRHLYGKRCDLYEIKKP